MTNACLALVCCILLISPGCHRSRKKAAATSEIAVASNTHKDRLRGIYPGEEGWRWTAPVFAFTLDPPPTARPVYLEMDFSVPDELMEKVPAVTVVAKVNGAEVARMTYQKPSRSLLACQVPAQLLTRRPAEVEFSVDRRFTDPTTSRVQGLMVFSVGLKEYEETGEYREAEMAKSRKAYEEVLKQRDLQLPIVKQRELMRLFHDLPIWESMRFHNVRIIKNPLDLWMLQQIAFEVRPDFVIETGTWYGGSALYWANTLNGMGLESARVLTVDIQDLTNEGASSHPLSLRRSGKHWATSSHSRGTLRVAMPAELAAVASVALSRAISASYASAWDTRTMDVVLGWKSMNGPNASNN